MTAATPRVSVVMSAYNSADYLALALDSILAQTFTDFECLVHDDGSTDGTWAILQEYAARDPRVIPTTGPNQGIVPCINQLIASARGEFIARMDADDICLPERFAKQVAFLDAHPDHVLLGANWLAMDGGGRAIFPSDLPLDHDEIDQLNIRGLTSLLQPVAMMRTQALRDLGGYDPEFRRSQDLDMWLRLAEVGQIANLPDILLRYRIHDQSASTATQGLQGQLARRACENAWARRGVTGSYDHTPYRPDGSRASRLAFYVRYGWDGWRWGFRDTWRYYALRAVQTDPRSADAWRLLIFGAIRRPPPGKYVLPGNV